MSWLRDVFYRQFADIRREEWPAARMLSFYFFLVIATFWILKPMKRAVIIHYFSGRPLHFFGTEMGGAESEQLAKVLNMIAAYVLVLVFTVLARHFPRHHLVSIFAATCGVLFVFFGATLPHASDGIVWSFYVFGDMFNTLMVATFWAFTSDLLTMDQARRTYGIVGLGGVLGGFAGSTLVNSFVKESGRAPLLYVCIIPMALIALIAVRVQRTAARRRDADDPPVRPGKGIPFLEAATTVFRSRYLLAIAALIGIYEVVSNTIDFQLSRSVEMLIRDSLAKDAFFSRVGQVIGIGSILTQLLVTGFVMRRFGLPAALAFLPVAILVSSSGFLLFPGLLLAGAMSAADNTFQYSIHQSAKEALYTRLPPDTLYKGKAFIDMFVQRFAKCASVVLNLVYAAVVTVGTRWLSVVSIVCAILWLFLLRSIRNELRRPAAQPYFEPGPAPEPVHEPVRRSRFQ
ncbi:MAG: hypothetical protein HYZ57_18005 [Acidobacteria bacterium]|nr:hypothetical protein [Acidobacteriota bacterium]MBI3281725.1 hypothetical protein [Acidobacteriota bacterium]